MGGFLLLGVYIGAPDCWKLLFGMFRASALGILIVVLGIQEVYTLFKSLVYYCSWSYGYLRE